MKVDDPHSKLGIEGLQEGDLLLGSANERERWNENLGSPIQNPSNPQLQEETKGLEPLMGVF